MNSSSKGIILFGLLLIIGAKLSLAQQDSVLIFYGDTAFIKKPDNVINWKQIRKAQAKDLTFSGTRISQAPSTKFDTSGSITFSGYLSCYYGWYSDSVNTAGFQKFPTSAPRSDAFSLNIAQLSAKYSSKNFRSIITFHYGDIPQSAWSADYNLIQEANMGFRILPKLWLDAGFFRTHIGIESIQPRENIAYSIATTTYFEPYFLSGAKLTWNTNSKLTLQVNMFNSFNTFIEDNSNKAIGLSGYYEFNERLNITANSILCDETPRYALQKKTRLYNNLYLAFKSSKLDVGFEVNYGTQSNTRLSDSMATATMWSTLLALKWKIGNKMAVYSRGEYFYDPDEILTGPVENSNHSLVGLVIRGLTGGIEVKPIVNSYLRLEGRFLETTSNEDIFSLNGKSSNKRYEILMGLGVWF